MLMIEGFVKMTFCL